MLKINKNLWEVILVFCLVFCFLVSKGQENEQKSILPEGITLNYGMANVSMVDNYFSNSVYNGSSSYLAISWLRNHVKYGLNQQLEFHNSTNMKSGNMTSDLINFSLYRDYNYPLKAINLGSKKIYPYLGPSTIFYLDYCKQNYADNGIYFNYSFNIIVGLGINSKFMLPIRENFTAESNVRINLISLGLHMPKVMQDDDTEDESPVKLQTAISAFHLQGDIGLRYYIIKPLSVKLAYKFQVTNIESWEESLKLATDILSIEIGIHF